MKFLDGIIADLKEVENNWNVWWKYEKEPFKYRANIFPILDALKEYEVDVPEEYVKERDAWDWDNGCLAYMEFVTGKTTDEFKSDNTYNQNSCLSHDIHFVSCESEDGEWYCALDVHRFGDIRGNYTDYALVKFDYDAEMFELFDDVISETCGGSVFVDDVEYYVQPTIWECCTVWCPTTGDGFEIFVSDEEDAIDAIREHMSEY